MSTNRAKERREFLASLPFVTLRKKPVRCEGYKWSRMPLRALRTGEADKFRCKNSAYWKFKAMKKATFSTSGTYCMSHLYTQFYDPWEEQRIHKYYDKWKEEH